jgi:hypothetical protein
VFLGEMRFLGKTCEEIGVFGGNPVLGGKLARKSCSWGPVRRYLFLGEILFLGPC